jgi:hypothetical protein
VLRFLLEQENGTVVPVEMRADEIRGVMQEGDCI